jgi:uncharacterized membrane protein
MGLPGMVISGIATVVGAIMYWVMSAQNAAQNSGFRLSTGGVILMITGAVGLVVSLLVFIMSRRSPTTPAGTVDRITKNEVGNTAGLHGQRS